MITRTILAAPLLAPLLALGLAGCGPATPEEAKAATVAKCERQFGRMAPSPDKGNALCTCMVNELEKSGLEVTDVFGADKEKVMKVTRSCAQVNGISIPG
ncbi:hypothetical protein [Altererythrobacter sp. ZODW24]|uniref:hypothetical protein n=1 Tax=Altererythrobacter sp. ZODW24 TaxID=2185142 RepID=UPI000DF83A44|nr:hypothetical protein [Altererythrobacter sp. ZODW24]